ncbi:hypothetical protein ACFSX9_04940 [Flavobacterium ardleyense]|uniref:SH3 domain-containing protein n=1 Tax=Flavobacterium ardleyense TaxID=2038737 RepID=A0ABW5Z5Q5_9FLAO
MKTIINFIITLLFVIPTIGNAQLCIIYDKDGATNVREEASIRSKVIGKLFEGQVFAISSYIEAEVNQSKEWIAVNFPLEKNAKEKKFLKFDGEEKVGFVHKSRLVELDELPVFERIKEQKNKAIHAFNEVQITIETQTFNDANHKIVRDKYGSYLIDGEVAYTYSEGTNIEIKSISMQSKNETFVIPNTAFKNLFMVDASRTEVYIGKKNEYYIVFSAADGSQSYNIIYCLKDNQLFSMTVTSVIP